MSKKNIFVVIIVIILLLAGISLMLLNNKDADIDVNVDVKPEESIAPNIPLEEKQEQNEKEVVDPLVTVQGQLKNKVRFFVERYNTYSSDNNKENLRNLLSQTSNKLTKDIKVRLNEENNQDDVFFSFQTKVLSIALSDFVDKEKAVFECQIEEQETKGEITEVHYKKAILEFIYENKEWKVDRIEIK